MLTVPLAVRTLASGRRPRLVWENEVGGRTYEVGEDPDRCFVKWSPHAAGIDLGREIDRLRWAVRFTPVPQVLAHGADATGSWLLTRALPGESAVSERWRAVPARAVAAIGSGLRALHEALPVAASPFSWAAADRVADARVRARAGEIDPSRWHEIHQHLTVDVALKLVAEPPPVDQQVVCHGDACAPNTLLTEDGAWSGHVDLGALGVADRWADLAVATWSTEWNYGAGWEDYLLQAYGVERDDARIDY